LIADGLALERHHIDWLQEALECQISADALSGCYDFEHPDNVVRRGTVRLDAQYCDKLRWNVQIYASDDAEVFDPALSRFVRTNIRLHGRNGPGPPRTTQ
jgi:hypothetical protein